MDDPIQILIIDDEPVVRTTLRMMMDPPEWAVEEAESAEQGLERFDADRHEVLLVDKNLPGKSGLDLIRELRERDAQVPCFIMTAQASARSAVEALELGIEAYLEKPFEDLAAVERLVRTCVVHRRRRRDRGEVSDAASFFRKARGLLQEPGSAVAVEVERDADGLRVLLASPCSEDRAWLRAQLEGHVSELVDATETAKALAAIPLLRPELAIVDSDLDAPGVTDFVKELLQQKPDAMVLVVQSRRLGLETVKQLIALGVHAILEPPLDAGSLRSKLAQIERRLAPRRTS